MNGAETLLRSAALMGVEVLFANPGTTELSLVAALDNVTEIRPVLALFEGVVTGAADGYGRMAGKPALTMMHLGPSFGNGIANLHNARRARSPIVNLVGDHPSWHRALDPPLASDIEALAGSVSGWVRSVRSVETVGVDTGDAITAATQGKVATLIVPADVQWSTAPAAPPSARGAPPPRAVDPRRIESVAHALRQGSAALLLGGKALSLRGQQAAARIASVTKCRLFSETFPARLECGRGIAPLERVPYIPALALAALGGLRSLVLAGAVTPVPFFAEPDLAPGTLVPKNVAQEVLAAPEDDVVAILEEVAQYLGAPASVPAAAPPAPPAWSAGKLTVPSITGTISTVQAEGTIFVDEGVSAGGAHLRFAPSCPPFTYLSLTGGATGQGLPCATGAAIACPDRKVIALVGDGAALYTVQALWTQAREQLEVVTIVLSNDAYKILELEMSRKSGAIGPRAKALTELAPPRVAWTDVARGLGVPSTSVETTDELARALRGALATRGPHVIQARL